ncbi:aminoacyl-tRNA hydrolase [Lacibacterium aquatile]|uniref:Peptidyl-tRNA hydrolase n=1 Tax=Lacibacterium aquatile TaxID=1168082 RepID=A0ABW5DJT4_9PROT
MWLFVGLGNPGREYAKNRHNIGFMAADEIVRRHRFSGWKADRKLMGEVADGEIAGEKIVVLKPMTYMNLSGDSVGAVARFYKIPIGNICVFHDELDLPPGKVRVKKGGGHGGHNGLKSIDAHCGKDYWRVRLGIGHPGDKNLVSPYVLGDFFKSETWVDPLVDAVAEAAGDLTSGSEVAFMNKIALQLPVAK